MNIFLAMLIIFAGFSFSANAQEIPAKNAPGVMTQNAPPPPPTMEDVQAQCLVETGQLRTALGQAQMQLKQLKSQLELSQAQYKRMLDLSNGKTDEKNKDTK